MLSITHCQNTPTVHTIKMPFHLKGIAVNILLFLHFTLCTLVANENEKVIKNKLIYNKIIINVKLLTFLLQMKKLITKTVCKHPVAMGRFFGFLCYLPWLLIKVNK